MDRQADQADDEIAVRIRFGQPIKGILRHQKTERRLRLGIDVHRPPILLEFGTKFWIHYLDAVRAFESFPEAADSHLVKFIDFRSLSRTLRERIGHDEHLGMRKASSQ